MAICSFMRAFVHSLMRSPIHSLIHSNSIKTDSMKRDPDFDFDLLIIGAGSGGLAGAKSAAEQGVRVGLIEKLSVGGTCANRGCVPKKLMFYAAEFAQQARLAKSFAWQGVKKGALDWNELRNAIQSKIGSIQSSIRSSLAEVGVELIQGEASFEDSHRIRLRSQATPDRIISAKHILLAVGAEPLRFDVPGIDLALTSNDLFLLEQLPESIVIVGGGYIGVEFAGILNAFGVGVTIVDISSQILSGFDSSIRSAIQAQLREQGIELVMGASLSAIEQTERGRRIHLSLEKNGAKNGAKDSGRDRADAETTLQADQVLVATGRKPALGGLNLEAAGVDAGESGAIAVNAQSRTSQPHIYAVGDCTARLPLTPVAKAEAEAVIQTLYQNHPTEVDYRWVPSSVFSHPPAASVGWTEEKAKEKLDDAVEVYETDVSPLRYGLADQSPPTLIKFVVSESSGEVLGLHVLGEQSAALVQSMTPALKRGIRFDQIQQTVAIHPTFGEEMLTF